MYITKGKTFQIKVLNFHLKNLKKKGKVSPKQAEKGND